MYEEAGQFGPSHQNLSLPKKDYEKQYPSVKNNYYNENLDFMSNLRSVFFYTDDTIYWYIKVLKMTNCFYWSAREKKIKTKTRKENKVQSQTVKNETKWLLLDYKNAFDMKVRKIFKKIDMISRKER